MHTTRNVSKNPRRLGWVLLAVVVTIPRLVSGGTALPSASQHADQLTAQMRALAAQGRAEEAIPIGVSAATLYEQLYGSDHPRVAAALFELSELYRRTGDQVRARSLFEQTLELAEKGLDSEASAPGVVDGLHFVKRQEPRGQSIQEFFMDRLYDRPLTVPVEVQRTDPDVIVMLRETAPFYGDASLDARSQQLLERALTAVEQGFSQQEFAVTLTDLAELHVRRGEYAAARRLSERAIGVAEAVLGRQHPVFTAALNNFAVVCDTDGDYGRAASLYKSALEHAYSDGGPYNPALVIIQSNAVVAAWKGRNAGEAVELFRQFADTRDRQMQSFFELGFHEENATALAETLRRETNVIISFAREAGGSAVNAALRSVTQNKGRVLDAMVRRVTGRVGIGDQPFDQQLASRISPPAQVQSTAPAEPAGAKTTDRQTREARVRQMREQIEHRRALQRRIEELLQSDECRMRPDACQAELSKFRKDVEAAWDQLMTGGGPQRLERRRESQRSQELRDRLARLRSQGLTQTEEYRALEAEFETLRDRSQQRWRSGVEEQLRQASEELRKVNARLSDLSVRGQRNTDDYDALDTRRRELEEDISYLREGLAGPEKPPGVRPPESKSDSAPPDLQLLQQLIPGGTALVEFALYEPFDPLGMPHWGSSRYIAFVLKRQGGAIAVDVGDAGPIETAVSDLLAALHVRGTTVTGQAKELYRQLVAPLRPHLADVEHVMISPDGVLNLLPFGVLQDDEGRYLVEVKTITYLTSGRDLLRLANRSPSRQGPIILANPDFGVPAGARSASAQGLSVDPLPEPVSFAHLPGTREEAQSLKAMLRLGNDQVLTEARATEAAVKQLKGPRILHLATHGFSDAAWTRGDGSLPGRQNRPPDSKLQDSLVRSGLALAGANQRRSGDDDGILTAREVAGLDLEGTELAVLSACETGIGQVQSGEGIYGLRRALMLAGVRMQVASLWKIDDAATRDIMVDFYSRLLAGTSRSQSLREAQLAMLRDSRYAHPFYWAAFIAIGDDQPMSGW